jgi:hypothetical protein
MADPVLQRWCFIDGGMKSAAKKRKQAAASAFKSPRPVFEVLCLRKPLTVKQLNVLATPKLYSSNDCRQEKS